MPAPTTATFIAPSSVEYSARTFSLLCGGEKSKKVREAIGCRAWQPSRGLPGFGSALRAARTAKSLSLSDVAAATSISPSFLSLVENGKSDITIGRLVRLVTFYGIHLGDLVPVEPAAEPDLVRKSEQRTLPSPAEGIQFRLLAPSVQGVMMPMIVEFEPSAHLAEFGRHAGEEFLARAPREHGARARGLRAAGSCGPVTAPTTAPRGRICFGTRATRSRSGSSASTLHPTCSTPSGDAAWRALPDGALSQREGQLAEPPVALDVGVVPVGRPLALHPAGQLRVLERLVEQAGA